MSRLNLTKYIVVFLFIFSACGDEGIVPQSSEKALVELLRVSDALKMYKGKLNEQANLIKNRVQEHGSESVVEGMMMAIENEDVQQLAYWSGFISDTEFISFELEKNRIFERFENEIRKIDSFSTKKRNSLLAKALTSDLSRLNVFRRSCETELTVCERTARNTFYNKSAGCAGSSITSLVWPACQANANLNFASSFWSCVLEYNDCRT